MAHGGSGDLYGGELRCVVWWRFRQAKDGTTPKEEAEGTTRTLSAPVICVAVVEVRREGSKGSTSFLSSFFAWSPFGKAEVFFLQVVVFFLRLERDLSESPHGRSLLAGVKHWFYATA